MKGLTRGSQPARPALPGAERQERATALECARRTAVFVEGLIERRQRAVGVPLGKQEPSLAAGSCGECPGAVAAGFRYVTYRVRLSRKTERGMYNMRKRAATRSHESGFVVPSQDEWVKAAYYDASGGGQYSYWKYPTNPGVFGDGTATAPSSTTLDPSTGDVTNASTQPLATFHASNVPAPSWCPAAAGSQACSTVNPFGIDQTTYAEIYQGSLSTVGQAKTTSPWGTLDQGGNVVEWTDTITPPPSGGAVGGPGDACTAASPTLPSISCGSRQSGSSPRTTRSSPPPTRGWECGSECWAT